MSLLELAAFVLTFGGVMAIIAQRQTARRAERPVKRWAVALSIAVTLAGIAVGIVGVATGAVSLV